MRYFFDTEFIEDGKTIDLISIGIVTEDDREYYAISTDFDPSKASDWVKANVISKLEWDRRELFKPRETIRDEVLAFIGTGKPEIWAYYADYDWVALCQLFGTMMQLPKGWPMYCRDIKQLCESLGNPRLPETGKGEHNALADARWNRLAFRSLLTAPPESADRGEGGGT